MQNTAQRFRQDRAGACLISFIQASSQSDNYISLDALSVDRAKTFPDHSLDPVSLNGLGYQALANCQAKAGTTRLIGLRIDGKPLIGLRSLLQYLGKTILARKPAPPSK